MFACLHAFCLPRHPPPVILPVSITSFVVRSWLCLSHSAFKHFNHRESKNDSVLSSNDGICDRRQTAESRARRSVRRRAAAEVGSNSGQPARGSPASLCAHITQAPLKAHVATCYGITGDTSILMQPVELQCLMLENVAKILLLSLNSHTVSLEFGVLRQFGA